jgi:pepF/M3 family oligoendopeptidase
MSDVPARRDFGGTLDAGETALPRWSVTDVHESSTSRSLLAAVEGSDAEVTRLSSLFDQHGIRQIAPRSPTADDIVAADAVISAYNAVALALGHLRSYVFASVSTDTHDEHAQALYAQLGDFAARVGPLLARLADWVNALGAHELAARSQLVRDHVGPLQRLAERSAFQMAEAEEALYSQLSTTGSAAWHRLHRDITSQLTAEVDLPGGTVRLPMPAVRGLATDPDPAVRRAALESERRAWPQVATACAAAMNAIKGEANTVNGRRGWASPLDASLFANNVSRPTFDAMQSAIDAALPRLRGWMRTKAALHGHDGPLPWSDLFAPLPGSAGRIGWQQGVDAVRDAFASYSTPLARLVDRALDQQWIDAAPREGKVGGASCTPFVDDRSLVLLNWNGSLSGVQTIAHELGHAYHNTQLAHRTPLQRRLPMALAETASIFCETLVVEAGLQRAHGAELLALLDVGLQGSLQVVVDIRSRVLFESEVFSRRRRRTLGVAELDAIMEQAQFEAYGDGLDQPTALASMWILKGHYYSSHFYNWPYTFGLLFGLGLFAKYRHDPERFQIGYDDLLSRAGMNTAEELGAMFGLDITGEAFWTASLDVIGDRISRYERLARREPDATVVR